MSNDDHADPIGPTSYTLAEGFAEELSDAQLARLFALFELSEKPENYRKNCTPLDALWVRCYEQFISRHKDPPIIDGPLYRGRHQ